MAPRGPVCVLAGAGTGKTRTITRRIAYLVEQGHVRADQVLAVTFTSRAAGELRSRLASLGTLQAGTGTVQARTFHAAALSQLRYFWPQAIGGGAPEVVGTKGSLVGEAAGRLRLQVYRTGLRDLAGEVEWAKVSMLTPETYPVAARRAGRQPADLDLTAMARLLDAYEDVKSARNVIDFEDVLLLTVGILDERDDVAATVRQQYRHFVVDEYQDVNALQQRLLDLWLGGRQDVCVVGDPAQTIYSFTGATPRHLLDFTRTHPGARKVELVRNYRSTPQVIEVANRLMASPGGGRRSNGVVLRAQRPAGARVTVEAHADDEAEAAEVAGRIRALVDSGVPASSIAVLFRTNGQSEACESALTQAGVPYLVRGGERFFSRSEVREAILLLRGAARTDDGSKPLPAFVGDVLGGMGWHEDAPSGTGAVRSRWESLKALVDLSARVAARGEQRLFGEPPALLHRIGQFGVGRTQFDTPSDQVPAFGDTGDGAVLTRQR